MNEVSFLTIKIDPKQGSIDKAASGESALLALVVIAAMLTVAVTIQIITKAKAARPDQTGPLIAKGKRVLTAGIGHPKLDVDVPSKKRTIKLLPARVLRRL
ncbi:hypothetical protein [Microvirga tunisiensis]|uniref:Uncharacterized protein n=1 Tax=Microvirga tunisiensis TaxID=2108360 RepID=A0A5N7MUR2_9HYPH|nr:hypothetical protein [Microvirga tunisiensis]MPR11801.1 hypothetical protein [Microvirga tunisiensis]MPR29834.1 hypothetical protein [Microvirga tunisiensis]